KSAMRTLGFRDSLLYTFVPASAWVARKLGETHVVYHCVDEYSKFDGAGDDITRLETELIEKSDLVITCSSLLQDSKSKINPRCATFTSSAASRTRRCPVTARRSTWRFCRSSRTSSPRTPIHSSCASISPPGCRWCRPTFRKRGLSLNAASISPTAPMRLSPA